jgi:hypothetical protein
MSRRLIHLLAPLCVLVGASTATPPALAAAPEWRTVSLPGGRAGLLPRLGMSPDVPVALMLGELIRIVHAAPELDNPAMETVRRYFAAPPEGNAELVPVPLSLSIWRDLLGDKVTDDTLVGAVLQNRRAALLCYGLLQLDRQTLQTVAGDQALIRRLYERRSGVFAGFAQVLHVRDGRLVLPGGDHEAATWAELVGEPLTDPVRAIAALVNADDGRMLYFIDAVAGLEPPKLALVFQGATPDTTPLDQARSVYRAFTRIESGWDLGNFPFVRLGADAALLLARLRTDAATGQLRHTRAFWDVVLGPPRLPEDAAERWADLDNDERADPGWLLRRLTDALLPDRVERLLIYEFTERLTDRLPRAQAANLAWLARGYRRYPALMLTLERLDINDAAVLMRLVTHAGRVRAVADDTAAYEIGLALYQAPLMLLTRALQAHALDAGAVRTLVASLSAIEPSRDGYGRAVAQWIDTALLPALGHDPSREGASPEATVLEAVAGLRAPASTMPLDTITWEAHQYRVDVAAPELARLTEVRGVQAGNTLDAALALCRAGAALARSDSLAGVREATAALNQVRAVLEPIERSERTTAPSAPDLASLAEQAARDLGRIRGGADLKRVTAIASRLARAEDAALADVLTSLLYAVWLGDPQGQAFLAGNVARRHDYGVGLLTGESREGIPWQLPTETSGDGEPWHVRGALLGLDLGLARLALRRTRYDRPEDQPTLNDSDRRTMMQGLAMTNALDLDQAGATRLLQWLRRGRAIVGSPIEHDQPLDALNLGGRRRQAIAWASAHTPEQVVTLLMRTELVLLGRDADVPLPPAWGVADTPRTGCLCLAFPDPPAVHRYVGRAGVGLLTSRMADLKLRVLEELDHRHLPAALARGVLASALHDYLEEARPAHGDDWFTLARQADRVSADRFDDYIAALTAGGPLVPLASAGPATGGHP